MKILTKEIEAKLQAQYRFEGVLEAQNVICKIFNPYGSGTWYLINQDPADPDYLWCIASIGYEFEVGSVLKSDLENIRIGKAKLPLERDLYFKEVNAQELFNNLISKEAW